MIHLRDYQLQAIAECRAALSADVNRVAVQLPTGTGKTVTFAAGIDEWLTGELRERGAARGTRRVLVLVHTDELVRQAVEKIRLVVRGGLWTVGVVKAGENEVGADIIVASVQTLANPARRAQIGDVGLIVVDEAHHATAPTYRAILEHFGGLPDCEHAHGVPCWDCHGTGFTGPPVPVLGFTATLVRSDGQGLGRVWQDLAFSRSLSWAIRKGYLVDLVAYRIEVPDLDAGASDAVLDAMLCDSIAPAAVVTSWMSTVMTDPSGAGPSTVLFAPLVKSAQTFADAFNAVGIKAEVVHGGLPAAERRAILDRYDAGVTTVVCNAMVLTEGWDSPRTKCVIVARPTKSVPLFVQMVGRGLRPWLEADAPPREEQRCVLLCVADSTTELVTQADLSDKPIQAKDGASLLEMEDEWDIGAGLLVEADRAYEGPVVAREFDPLVQRSSKVWAFTEAGCPFLPVGKAPDYVFLVHEPDGWAVFWYAGGRGARRLLRAIPDLELAMTLAEDEATDRGGDIGRLLADKGRAWRRERPSTSQMEMAVSVGIPVRHVEELLRSRHGGKAGRLADMIDRARASKRLDPMVIRILERAENVVPAS
jgi:superfamily II DNA or RNA helicase